MTARPGLPARPTFAGGAVRVFSLSLGEMLWSRRTVFLLLVTGAPVFLALVARIVQGIGIVPLRVNGAAVVAHWLLTGLPLILVAPVFGLLFDMHGEAIASLTFSLLLGTPILSLLGGVGAALTLELGLRSGACCSSCSSCRCASRR